MAKRIVTRSLSVPSGKPSDGVPFPAWPDPNPKPGAAIVPIRQTALSSSDRGRLALDDFLRYGQIERRYSRPTIVRYRKVVGDFITFLGPLDFRIVRPGDIRSFFAFMLDRGSSDQTLYQALCALRSFYRYCEIFDLVAVSPARAVQTRKLKKRIPKPLSIGEIDKLIQSAANLRDRAMFEFFYATGCRIAEVAGARVEDIRWSERTVKILGKGNRERLVPLDQRTIDLLVKYLAGRTEGWIFLGEGQPDQHEKLQRTRNGKWQGCWRENYAFDCNGRLTSTNASRLLGKVSEVTGEEARAKLAQIVSKLPARPRPTKSQPLSTRAIRAIIQKAALRAGLGHINPHQLRHTFATHLHARGADIFSVSRLLGDAHVSTTEIYAHVDQTTLRETLQRCHPHWTKE
jgi:site-specific recombinase XerD